ncbi:hypothetical protein JOD54_001312 [Actinokineospora baliensis]|uniref:hypothetical protein n=1 Tax=Actinokineospora baliensis TaxID=547056 RepID=UPI0019595657|nr:hypothetical protein [Actinokineospora baliensis]MBM7771108.1 hypothetical protein [Actinokineospora baliensis]
MQLDERALHTLLDGPAPAATTTLAMVVRRGRRKIRSRLLGVGVVVVLVFGMAGGFVVVATPPPAGPAWITSGRELDWPRVTLSRSERVARGQVGPTPRPVSGATSRCPTGVLPQLVFGEVAAVDLLKVRPALVAVLPTTEVGTWEGVSSMKLTGVGGVGNIVELNLADSDGVGSLSLSRASFTGSPTAYADALAFVDGNCEPPKRRTTADGTVIQVYAAVPEPNSVLRMKARIFRPSGELLIIEARNMRVSATSFKEGSASAIDRQPLPMTEQQLGTVAELAA